MMSEPCMSCGQERREVAPPQCLHVANHPPPASVQGMIEAMLDCEWGISISRPDDPLPCHEKAVQFVVLHDGPHSEGFKLCARHYDLVLDESTPRP